MYRFYRMDKDEKDNDVLHVVEACSIQGDRIPAVPKRYHHVLFHLGIDDKNKVFVRRAYTSLVPENLIAEVEEYINGAEDKRALPTYFHDHILLNGVERIPHLHLVYIAESEDTVWEFVKE